jgi:Fanconi-associated nuclease 1
MGAANVSQICKIFSEEYGHRTGGMPDLCLWKYSDEEKRCLFSEVKGPGDRLSETQENWIDFLAGLGGTLEVELCHLREMKDDVSVDIGKDVGALKTKSRKRSKA